MANEDPGAVPGHAHWSRRQFRAVPSSLVGASLVAGLAGLIAVRELNGAASFDEGVYLNSLRAMQGGASLGRQVFASQPPGFYLLLRLDAFLFPGSLAGLRLGFAFLGLAACLSVFALGRLYSGALGGTVAALLFAASPPVVELTSRVSPDLAAVSFSLMGIALLAHAWENRFSRRWLEYLATFAGGAALAAAVTVKLDGVFAVLAVGALAAIVRPSVRLLLVALSGLAVALACVLFPFVDVAQQLWRSVVSFHLAARHAQLAGGTTGVRANATQIVSTFEPRSSIVGWLIFIGASACLVQGLRRADRRVLWLLVWPVSVLGFLLWQSPLFSHHVVLLAGAAAVPAGVGFGQAAQDASRWRRLAGALAVAGAFGALAVSALQPVQPEPNAVTQAVSVLRASSSKTSRVLATDLPIVPFLAHRAVPPALVDTSWVRLLSGSLTRRRILAVVRSDHVAAVLAGRRLLASAPTRKALQRMFRHQMPTRSDNTLYLRTKDP